MTTTIQFGFEFETLVFYKNGSLAHVAQYDDTNKNILDQINKWYQSEVMLEKECIYLPKQNELRDVISRFDLATNSIRNAQNDAVDSSDSKSLYKVAPSYKKDPCSPVLNSAMLGNTWVIDHDASVKTLQTPARYTAFYTNLTNSFHREFVFEEYSKDTKRLHPGIVEHVEFVSPIYTYNLADLGILKKSFDKHMGVKKSNDVQIRKDILRGPDNEAPNGVKIQKRPVTKGNITLTKCYMPDLWREQDPINLFYFNNSTTSNHIHFSVNQGGQNLLKPSKDEPLTQEQKTIAIPKLLSIVRAWLLFEPVFFALCPQWRRDNEYCLPMRELLLKALEKSESDSDKAKTFYEKIFYDFGNYQYDTLEEIIETFQGDPSDGSARYAAFNMMNVIGRYGTVEIRVKHGSTDSNELVNYIHLFANVISSAINLFNDETGDFVQKENKFFSVAELTLLNTQSDRLLLAQFDLLLKFCSQGGVASNEFKELARYFLERLFYLNPAAATDKITEYKILTQLETGTIKSFDENDIHHSRQEFNGQTMELETDTTNDFGILGVHANRGATAMEFDFDPPSSSGGAQPEPLSNKRFPYFGYGSNSSKQLAERTGSQCLEPLPAYLNNYTRIFAGYSKFREGGVASIHPFKGSRVYGCVYQLTQEELATLDRYEPGYTRAVKFVNVTLPSGHSRKIRCFTYIRDESVYSHPPSLSYMQAIRTMLDEAKPKTRGKVHIRGITTEGEGRKQIFKLKTFGYFFRNKLTLYKRPLLFRPENTAQAIADIKTTSRSS